MKHLERALGPAEWKFYSIHIFCVIFVIWIISYCKSKLHISIFTGESKVTKWFDNWVSNHFNLTKYFFLEIKYFCSNWHVTFHKIPLYATPLYNTPTLLLCSWISSIIFSSQSGSKYLVHNKYAVARRVLLMVTPKNLFGIWIA